MEWAWWLALSGVLAAAAFLRFDGLGEPSLWLDEILHVEKTREAAAEPLSAWLGGVAADRENGSLYYAGQLLALSLFEGEVAVRLVPAVAGLLTVGVLFLVALSATGDRRTALVAAALLAVSPLHVYYSREGRPYAAVMLLAALLLLLALEARRPWTRFAVYGVCLALAYMGAVGAPVLAAGAALAGLEWLRYRRGGHFLVAPAAALGLGLLLFPTVERLGGAVGALNSTARWEITRPLSGVALDRLLASLTVSGVDRGSTSGLSWLLLALALWGGFSIVRGPSRQGWWVAGMCALPIAGWLALLVAFDHWYNVRYTSAGLPAFLVLVAVGLVDLWRRGEGLLSRYVPQRPLSRPSPLSWLSNVLLAAVLALLLATPWRHARAEPLDKTDWRGVARLLGTLAMPGDTVLARGPWAATCLGHYLRELQLPLEIVSANYDPAFARRWTESHPHTWVISAGWRETPEFRAWARDLDPIFREPSENLELLFFPDFSTLLSDPKRAQRLAAALALVEESAVRLELTGSELLLGAGWSYPERGPEGMTFRWALGERAEMALAAPSDPGTGALRLRLLPFPSPDLPPQSVEIAVNGRPVARLTLEPGWQEISVPLYGLAREEAREESGEEPREEAREEARKEAREEEQAGRGHDALDRVTFSFAWSQSPRDLDPASQDPRPLAVAFDFVEVVSKSSGL